METNSLPFTLYPSKRKLVGSLVFFLAVLGTGVWITLGSKKTEWIGWAGVVFFGFFSFLSFRRLISSSECLTVDEDGFKFQSGSYEKRFKWQEIVGFGTYNIGPGTRSWTGASVGQFVGFHLNPDHKDAIKGIVPKVMSLFGQGGFDGQIPDTYGLSAVELAQLLTKFHLEALKRSRGASPPNDA